MVELDYQQRKWKTTRKAIFWTVVIASLCAVPVGIDWGVQFFSQAIYYYRQWQCMTYSVPAGRMVFIGENAQSAARYLASGSEYIRVPVTTTMGGYTAIPDDWERFAALVPAEYKRLALDLKIQNQWNLGAICFMHERLSRSGNRRLVVVHFACNLDTVSARLLPFLRCHAARLK